MNEKFAPELLESKPEIVECVMEQLDHMVRAAWSLRKRKFKHLVSIKACHIANLFCSALPRILKYYSLIVTYVYKT